MDLCIKNHCENTCNNYTVKRKISFENCQVSWEQQCRADQIVVTHFVCGIKMWHLSEQAYHCCHCWDENTAHKTMVLYKQRVISTLQRMCYDSHYLANMLQAITKINSWIHRKLKNCKPTFTCDDFILSLSRNILHGSRWQIFVIL